MPIWCLTFASCRTPLCSGIQAPDRAASQSGGVYPFVPANAGVLAADFGDDDLPHAALLREGKSYLTTAIGCTGGQHRSVMMAEELGKSLRKAGYRVKVSHRDMPK